MNLLIQSISLSCCYHTSVNQWLLKVSLDDREELIGREKAGQNTVVAVIDFIKISSFNDSN